jgi:hypothetical protein
MNQQHYVYRGVHAKHPMRAAALKGTVVPGDPNGDITPEQHNLQDQSAISPFTSWTHSEEIAREFANSSGAGGIVLRLPIEEPPDRGDTWDWVESPDSITSERFCFAGLEWERRSCLNDGPRLPATPIGPRTERDALAAAAGSAGAGGYASRHVPSHQGECRGGAASLDHTLAQHGRYGTAPRRRGVLYYASQAADAPEKARAVRIGWPRGSRQRLLRWGHSPLCWGSHRKASQEIAASRISE